MSHKIRLRLENFEIEVSGDKEFVNEEFKKLEERYLNSNFKNQLDETKKINTFLRELVPENDLKGKYPSMQNIIIKQIPKTEFDWVLIYGFYKSNYGKKTFSKKDINDFYEESKRKTKQRIKNIAYNLNSLVKKDFIKALNDTEFVITETGIKKSEEILNFLPVETNEVNENESK
jgi:hypothetical protein